MSVSGGLLLPSMRCYLLGFYANLSLLRRCFSSRVFEMVSGIFC